VLLAAVLGGPDRAPRRLLGDLLAALQRLLAGLLHLILDLVGHGAEPLVLDPGGRHRQPGQEAQGGGADGQAERVLLRQPGRLPGPLLGALLGLPTARVASPAFAAVPLTACFARLVASLTFDRAASTLSATASLARDGTSAL
jgi:hypothetical protein